MSFFITAIFNFAALKRLSTHAYYLGQSLLSLAFERDLTVQLAVPFFRQEHSLSCEVAALRMVLSYYGISLTEDELIKNLRFDTILPRSINNLWGDPDKGFVGNIDGTIPNSGYGVYENPIVSLASKYRDARVLNAPKINDILEQVARNHPVIVWGTVASGKDISWATSEGKKIKAILGEHTRVVIGFSGTVSIPRNIILLDPIYGKIKMTKNKFLSDWSLLDNKAVLVY